MYIFKNAKHNDLKKKLCLVDFTSTKSLQERKKVLSLYLILFSSVYKFFSLNLPWIIVHQLSIVALNLQY